MLIADVSDCSCIRFTAIVFDRFVIGFDRQALFSRRRRLQKSTQGSGFMDVIRVKVAEMLFAVNLTVLNLVGEDVVYFVVKVSTLPCRGATWTFRLMLGWLAFI